MSYRLPRAVLMRWDTCRDPNADKNSTTTYASSEYLEMGGDRTDLSSDLKNSGVVCTEFFFWKLKRARMVGKLMIEILVS